MKLVRLIAPRLADEIRSRAHGNRVRRFEHELQIDKASAEYCDRYPCVVRSGPFRGLRYLKQSAGSQLIPKLTGTYEMELHGWVQMLIDNQYETIIDVGAAEGYYAIGLAACCPGTQVVTFDTDPVARRLCRRLAKQNAVADRLDVRATCSPENLGTAIRGRTLVISDCEGYEATLLDPVAVPALTRCELLVELHEADAPGVSRLLIDRFTATHVIELKDSRHPAPTDLPADVVLPSWCTTLAVMEFRAAGQQWLLATPKSA